MELTTIVPLNTILNWHRELVAKKFDAGNKRNPERPRIRQEIVDAGHVIVIGQPSIENADRDYVVHCHTVRNHQGLDSVLIQPDE